MVNRPVPYPDEPPNIEKDTIYPYLSPLLDRLTPPQNLVPDGDFLLPICTTSERMLALLKVIRAGAEALDLRFIGEHSIDVLEALAHLDNPLDNPCLSVDGDLCRVYKPSGSIFDWELWSPYSGDPFPTGYNRAPFVLYDPDNLPAWVPAWVTNNLLGLQPGDVFTSVDAFAATGLQAFLNALTTPIDELPYFVINATGGNTLRIKLFGVPQGGFVRIYTRNAIGSGIVFDLDSASVLDSELSDLLNLVIDGELFPEHIVDYDVPGVGAQEVVVVFLPDYSGGVSVGFGGGIRSVEVCGEVVAVEPEFRITGCDLEWRPDAVSNWIVLGNVCGQDGADGSNAPIPTLNISAVEGGHNLGFDLDGDSIPDASLFVPDGQDGANAPIPTLNISAVEGGHNLGFDLDGDSIPDASLFVPDGVDGTDGTDGITPQPIISNLAEGVFIGWDLNDNGTSDTTQVKISGDCDCEGYDLPATITDTQKCNAALYIASQVIDLAKDAAYEIVVNSLDDLSWWQWLLLTVSGNPAFGISQSLYNYISAQSIADYNAFAAQLDAAEPVLAELIYCEPLDLPRSAAVSNWQAEPIAAPLTAQTHETISLTMQAISLSTWLSWSQVGLLQTGGDCSGFCEGSWSPETIEISMASNAYEETSQSTEIGKTYQITASGSGNYSASGSVKGDAFYFWYANDSGVGLPGNPGTLTIVDGVDVPKPRAYIEDNHVYVFTVNGTGEPLEITYQTGTPQDNNGIISYLIEEI